MMGVGRQYGDVVRFACEQGYKMFGVQEVLCQQTGLWNLPAPSCHSKYLDILLTSFLSNLQGIWCDAPILGNGLKIAGQAYNNYPHRTRLSLQCQEGYTLRGDLSIHCQANGRWSRPEGACHRKTITNKIYKKSSSFRSFMWLSKSRSWGDTPL